MCTGGSSQLVSPVVVVLGAVWWLLVLSPCPTCSSSSRRPAVGFDHGGISYGCWQGSPLARGMQLELQPFAPLLTPAPPAEVASDLEIRPGNVVCVFASWALAEPG